MRSEPECRDAELADELSRKVERRIVVPELINYIEEHDVYMFILLVLWILAYGIGRSGENGK